MFFLAGTTEAATTEAATTAATDDEITIRVKSYIGKYSIIEA